MPFYVPDLHILEAVQWFKNGDIPGDGVINNINQGAVVGRYCANGEATCSGCGALLKAHGLLKSTNEMVCPGDYIIIHRNNKNWVMSYTHANKDAFEKVYTKIKPEDIEQWKQLIQTM